MTEILVVNFIYNVGSVNNVEMRKEKNQIPGDADGIDVNFNDNTHEIISF